MRRSDRAAYSGLASPASWQSGKRSTDPADLRAPTPPGFPREHAALLAPWGFRYRLAASPTATAATGVLPISPAANTARQLPATWRRARRSCRNPRHDQPSGPSCTPSPTRLLPATLPGRWRQAPARITRTRGKGAARAGSAAYVRLVEPGVASHESVSRSAATDPSIRKGRCSVFALPLPLKRVQTRAPPRNRSPRG